ncbi:MAG: hypothetical protein ACK559_22285, partial [bacterium]
MHRDLRVGGQPRREGLADPPPQHEVLGEAIGEGRHLAQGRHGPEGARQQQAHRGPTGAGEALRQ